MLVILYLVSPLECIQSFAVTLISLPRACDALNYGIFIFVTQRNVHASKNCKSGKGLYDQRIPREVRKKAAGSHNLNWCAGGSVGQV